MFESKVLHLYIEKVLLKQGSNVIRIFCYDVVEVCFLLICVPATHLNLHPAVEIIVCRWPSRKHTHNRSNSKSGFSPSGNSQSQVLTLLLARKVWFVCSLRGKFIILITAGALCLLICLVSGSGPLWLVWAGKKRVISCTVNWHFSQPTGECTWVQISLVHRLGSELCTREAEADGVLEGAEQVCHF